MLEVLRDQVHYLKGGLFMYNVLAVNIRPQALLLGWQFKGWGI